MSDSKQKVCEYCGQPLNNGWEHGVAVGPGFGCSFSEQLPPEPPSPAALPVYVIVRSGDWTEEMNGETVTANRVELCGAWRTREAAECFLPTIEDDPRWGVTAAWIQEVTLVSPAPTLSDESVGAGDLVHIGTIRREWFLDYESAWNGFIRDATAELEQRGEMVSRSALQRKIAEHCGRMMHAWAFAKNLHPASPIASAPHKAKELYQGRAAYDYVKKGWFQTDDGFAVTVAGHVIAECEDSEVADWISQQWNQQPIASAQEVIAELYEALKPFPGSPRFSDSDDDEDEWWCCCCDAAAQKIGDELKHEDDCIIARAWKALARAESLRKEAK